MPELSQISYSRDECVAAFRDYFDFLTKMYLKPSEVLIPPKGGWPEITADSLQSLGKTDTVIDLLRHLPYISGGGDPRYHAQGFPSCYFADWTAVARRLITGGSDQYNAYKIETEGHYAENVPAHVVGLTIGGRDNVVFLLDTELGNVTWTECPTEVQMNPSREQIEDYAYEYAPPNEADTWRSESSWAITDFFELLKDHFRELRFIPRGSREVFDVYTTYVPELEGMLEMLQGIYREHGWPDLDHYRKQECLEAVQMAMEDQYPDRADRRDDEGDVEREAEAAASGSSELLGLGDTGLDAADST